MAISAANLMVTFKADTKNAEAGIQRVNKGITGFAKSAASVGAGILGAGAFNAIARGFAGAGSAALDFGANMANVNSIAQLSGDALASVSDGVLAIAEDPRIAQAPAVLAAGLYDIYSSGFQGADALNVLQAAALAATAGITDTATSARAITSVINAFGLTAKDAGHISDVLFQTVNDGVITFEQLANNLGNTIPIANSLGLGIEDVGAAYAQMTLKGVNASAAETQIAALMRSALNPTEKLTAAVQAHGFESAEAAIKTKGLSGFLDILNDASGGSQTAMMDLLGTQEAMNAATILGADGVKDYRKELDKMKGASKGTGATNKALAKQMESASFQIAKAKQSLLTFATIGVGIVAPVIGRIASGMTGFLQKGLIPFINIIGDATKGGFAFNEFVQLLPKPLQRSAHAVGVITEALGDMWRDGFSRNEMRQALHGLQAIGQEIGQGARFAANIAIDTAVSLAGWLWDHKDDIWGGIKSLVGWTADEFTSLITWTIDGAIKLAGDIGDAVGDIWGWLKEKIMGSGPVGDATGGPSPGAGANTIDFGTVAITAAVKLGGAIAAIAGDIWGWVKSQLIGGAGSVSQDPASPMSGQAGQSIDMGAWTLNVAAPAVASAVGDIGDWVNRYLFNQTNNQEVGPVSWKLNLSLPSIGLPESFASGQQAGEYIRGKLGAISASDVPWKLALAAPAILIIGPPVAIGALIVEKLTGIGPVKLTTWTLTVLAPSTVAFGFGVTLGLIPGAIRTALDEAGIAVKGFTAWTLNVGTAATFTVAWTAEQIATKIKTTIGVIPDIKAVVNFTVDLTIDVVKHVKTGAEGIWDFLTGHITPLSAGGMPGGMGVQAPDDINISQAFSVTATLNKAQWDADYQAIFDDVAAINGTTATAKTTMNKADWDTSYNAVFTQVNSINQTTATAHANLDINQFMDNYDVIMAPGGLGDQINAATFTAHADLNLDDVYIAYTEAFTLGDIWAAQTFSASFSIDTSGLWAAAATADMVAAHIAAVMPHSPAKEGPLSKPISFQYIADDADRMAGRVYSALDGALSGGRHQVGMRGGRNAGGHNITINALKSAELIKLIKKAENGDSFARGLGRELGLSGGF